MCEKQICEIIETIAHRGANHVSQNNVQTADSTRLH